METNKSKIGEGQGWQKNFSHTHTHIFLTHTLEAQYIRGTRLCVHIECGALT